MADTLSSKTRAGGPFGIGNAYLEDSAVPLAALQMQNQSAIRNKPINPALASALQDAVTRTYGSGPQQQSGRPWCCMIREAAAKE
jgi:hypothetical protein